MIHLNNQERLRAKFALVRGRPETAVQSVLFVNPQAAPPNDPLTPPLDKMLALYPGLSVRRFETAQIPPEQIAAQLLETVNRYQPDILCLPLASPHDFSPDWLFPVTWQTDTLTCIWTGDDSPFRTDYAQTWLPAVDYLITTDSSAPADYAAWGIGHQVVPTRWACLPQMHRRLSLEQDLEVTFIGPASPARQTMLQTLAAQNLPVAAYGPGWADVPLPAHYAAQLVNRSRINLNLPFDPAATADLLWQRTLTIMACGGFLLTPPLPDLAAYFSPGYELVVFESAADLADKIRYYLAHPAERAAIAAAGYERVHREHTGERRLAEVLAALDTAPGNGDRRLRQAPESPDIRALPPHHPAGRVLFSNAVCGLLGRGGFGDEIPPLWFAEYYKSKYPQDEVWFFDYRGRHHREYITHLDRFISNQFPDPETVDYIVCTHHLHKPWQMDYKNTQDPRFGGFTPYSGVRPLPPDKLLYADYLAVATTMRAEKFNFRLPLAPSAQAERARLMAMLNPEQRPYLAMQIRDNHFLWGVDYWVGADYAAYILEIAQYLLKRYPDHLLFCYGQPDIVLNRLPADLRRRAVDANSVTDSVPIKLDIICDADLYFGCLSGFTYLPLLMRESENRIPPIHLNLRLNYLEGDDYPGHIKFSGIIGLPIVTTPAVDKLFFGMPFTSWEVGRLLDELGV